MPDAPAADAVKNVPAAATAPAAAATTSAPAATGTPSAPAGASTSPAPSGAATPVAPAADAKKPADAPAAPVSAKPKTLIVEDEPAAGDKPAAEKAPEPPKADWKLEAPKDHALDPADLGALEKSFKGAGLDQAKAQALLNEHAALQKSQVERAYTVWHDQAMKDPEIGGEKMPATLTNVKRAMGLLCTAEERKVIANSAFANNPIFLRVMNRAAALIPQEDGTKIVGAQPVGKQMPSTVAGAVDLMYGHLRK